MKSGLLSVVFLLASCVTASENTYTPAEVNATWPHLEGQHIAIRGYVLLGTNSRVLYQSRELYIRAQRALEAGRDITDDNNCLTILNNDEGFWRNSRRLNNHTVIFHGTVRQRSANTFDLQGCVTAQGNATPAGFEIDSTDLAG